MRAERVNLSQADSFVTVFFIHLKLKLLAPFSSSNEENISIYKKTDISQIELFAQVTSKRFVNFTGMSLV